MYLTVRLKASVMNVMKYILAWHMKSALTKSKLLNMQFTLLRHEQNIAPHLQGLYTSYAAPQAVA